MGYSTIGQVRRNNTISVDYFTGASGTSFDFRDNYTTSVVSVHMNGSSLTSGSAWTFSEPYTVNIVSGFDTADKFKVVRYTLLTDEEVQEIIDDADALINAKLSVAYDTSTLSSSHPFISSMAKKLARAMVVKRLNTHEEYSVNEAELKQTEMDIAFVMGMLDSVVRGEIEITDASQDVVARKANHAKKTVHVKIDDSTEAL